MMTRRHLVAAALLVTISLGAAACAKSDRQRPVGLGPVGTGAGSLEYTRKQLEGTWTLSKFEVANASGQLVPVRAKAQLTYDDFGNMTIKGVLLEPLPGQKSVTDAPALEYTGRAIIDTAKQDLVLVGLEATVQPDPSILAKIGMDARRHYEITDKQLIMTAKDAQGHSTSRATYTR